jgi:hypothetical protein
MVNLPKEVQQQIRDIVYKKADEHEYLLKDRSQNGSFIKNLVKDESVGGRLSDFIRKQEIKTYIKDAVLNRYAKDRRKLPRDVSKEVSAVIKTSVTEFDYKNRISVYRTEDGKFVVVTRGTYLKWETALRKGLEFISAYPALSKGETKVALLLAAQANYPPASDRQFLTKVLSHIGVIPIFHELPTKG